MSQYTEQADQFMAANGLEFHTALIGDDCPTFCEDALADKDMDKINIYPRKTHIHGKHYRCTISAKGREHFSVDFWNSYSDEEENFFNFGTDKSLHRWVVGRENCYWDKYRIGRKYSNPPRTKKRITPQPYDILACLTKCDPGTFENFCSEFGYSNDSRRAKIAYHSVLKKWSKVQKFFTQAELEAIQEID